MSRDKFDGLVPNFSAAYQKIQEERYQNKEIKWLPKGEKLGVFLSHEERLLFVLFYLKIYPTFDVLGFHFGLSAGQAHDYVELFLRVLERALTDLGQLPEVTLETPEDLSQLVDQYNDMVVGKSCVMSKVFSHQATKTRSLFPGRRRSSVRLSSQAQRTRSLPFHPGLSWWLGVMFDVIQGDTLSLKNLPLAILFLYIQYQILYAWNFLSRQ